MGGDMSLPACHIVGRAPGPGTTRWGEPSGCIGASEAASAGQAAVMVGWVDPAELAAVLGRRGRFHRTSAL